MKEKINKKGIAGLNIIVSLVVMLFIIGLLVMVFSLMSGSLTDSNSLYERTGDLTITAETITQNGLNSGKALSVATLRGARCAITAVTNATAGGKLIASGNYTENPECYIKNLTSEFSDSAWKVNYTYSYLIDESGAVDVINKTGQSISSVTDWFDIFLVIGAMVVLILLVVIIIQAIRTSGVQATTGTGNYEANEVAGV